MKVKKKAVKVHIHSSLYTNSIKETVIFPLLTNNVSFHIPQTRRTIPIFFIIQWVISIKYFCFLYILNIINKNDFPHSKVLVIF